MGTMICAVLFDLDGVVRHFDHDPELERRHDLEPDALARAAFDPPLLEQVTTGRITRAEWVARIGAAVGSRAAAEEWGRTPFRLDPALTGLADELRSRGIRCAILTNGTDTIAAEATESGLDRHFDPILNSAEIGHAKPDRRAFAHAAGALGLGPEQIVFTDDSASKLAGAQELGMLTHHFTGIDGLITALRDAGLPLDDPRNTPVTEST